MTPYLAIRNAVDALEFYKKAFGATETFRLMVPDGRLGHGEIRLGDSVLCFGRISGSNDGVYRQRRWAVARLHPLVCRDVDAFSRRRSCRRQGRKPVMTTLRRPLRPAGRSLQSPWWVATHGKTSMEELQKRMRGLMLRSDPVRKRRASRWRCQVSNQVKFQTWKRAVSSCSRDSLRAPACHSFRDARLLGGQSRIVPLNHRTTLGTQSHEVGAAGIVTTLLILAGCPGSGGLAAFFVTRCGPPIVPSLAMASAAFFGDVNLSSGGVRIVRIAGYLFPPVGRRAYLPAYTERKGGGLMAIPFGMAFLYMAGAHCGSGPSLSRSPIPWIVAIRGPRVGHQRHLSHLRHPSYSDVCSDVWWAPPFARESGNPWRL